MKSIESFVNQVIHGDCVKIMQSFPDESIDLVVTDPPYLVNYTPRDGRRIVNDDNYLWLAPAFGEIYRVLKPDTFCATFYGWPWIGQFMHIWTQSGFRPVSHLIWVKDYCSRKGYTEGYHEVGYLLAKGRPQRPVKPPPDALPWMYTGNVLHPNQKPLIAIEPLIEAYSRPNDIILDPFAGSGTTGIAARTLGRRFILIEEVQSHCNAAQTRFRDLART